MSSFTHFFIPRRTQAILSVAMMLTSLAIIPMLHAGDCGCDHHGVHCHHCPPGLLDRLNNISDAVEYRWHSLMHRLDQWGGSRSCDGCDTACDACDHPLNAWLNLSSPMGASRSHHHHYHQQVRAEPTSPAPNQSAAKLREPPKSEYPVHQKNEPHLRPTPKAKGTEAPKRLPEWLKDPFKDEARTNVHSRVRAASTRSVAPARALQFDPRAQDSSRKSLEDLIEETILQRNHIDTELLLQRIAVGPSPADPAIRKRFTDKDRSDHATSAATTQAHEQVEVVTAAAFEPVRIHPVKPFK